MNTKWTLEKIKAEALKYQSRNAFQRGSSGAYQAATRANLLDDVCAHMGSRHKYTLVQVAMEAAKFNTRNEFKTQSSAAYAWAIRNGVLDAACLHMAPSKTYRKWDKESIAAEALKYSSRSEFQKHARGGYVSALNQGILDEVCRHMKAGNRKWDKESIAAEALKYSSRSEFQKHARGGYMSALNQGILDDVCRHMTRGNRIWDKESIAAEALKYGTRLKFIEHSSGAYSAARKLNILDDVCQHMTRGNRKWDKESIAAEALKYSSRFEFQKHARGGYMSAFNQGILDEVCRHMKPLKKREWTKGRIAKEALKYGLRSEFQKHSCSAYFAARRLNILGDVCQHMSSSNNKGGRPRKWTPEKIAEQAAEYTSKKQFKNGSNTAFKAAQRLGILDDVCAHMPINKRGGRPTEWTHEKLAAAAQKFTNRKEFEADNSAAYMAARRRGLLDEICAHMVYVHDASRQSRIFSEDELFKLAASYTNISLFRKERHRACVAARKRGIFEKITAHMVKPKKWTEESIREVALTFDCYKTFCRKMSAAYREAKALGIIEDVTSHMADSKKIFWTEDKILSQAHRYTSKSQLSKENGGMYHAAWSQNLFSHPAFAHFDATSKKMGDDTILRIAEHYPSMAEFKEKRPVVFRLAQRKPLLMAQIIKAMPSHNELAFEDLFKVALKFHKKADFQQVHPQLYQSSKDLGVDKIITKHMI